MIDKHTQTSGFVKNCVAIFPLAYNARINCSARGLEGSTRNRTYASMIQPKRILWLADDRGLA